MLKTYILMRINHAFEWGEQHPRQLFLIDGVGALVSAIMWGAVFAQFETITGFPTNTCYFLSVFPLLFIVFDFASYQWAKNLSMNLRIIAMLNLGYALLSMIMLFMHVETITFFGYAYLFLELAIVLLLAGIECKVSIRVKTNSSN